MTETVPMDPPPEVFDPPALRLGCVALTLNPDGAILMVRPKNRPAHLILPGGSAEADEAPNEAAARWVYTKTGLALDLWQLVSVDYVSVAELAEGINLVFWGGRLSARRAGKVVPGEGVIEAVWVPPGDLTKVTYPQQVARVIEALRTAERGGGLPLLLRGRPVG
ncbi:NUDIX domain-containing protein [Kitasatospora sp. NPDC056783]|uniref:NUDIX domain-containing protein n=1 Tax=Kitasatospora sp. NPDC056783 TaxID=3345943 RepID=UPI00369E7BD5